MIESDTPEGTVHHAYDPATGQLQATWTGTATAPTAGSGIDTLTAYGYDTQGRIEHVYAFRDGGSTEGTYTGWDSDTHEPTYTGTPLITTYTYDDAGNLATVTQPNGVMTDYDYDTLNRLTQETVTNSSSNKIFEQAYTIAGNGQRDSVIEKYYDGNGNDASHVLSNVKITWEYDDDGRLVEEMRDAGPSGAPDSGAFDTRDTVAGGDYSDVFAYDLAGNRMKQIRGWDANSDGDFADSGETVDSTTVYFYDNRDRLLSENLVELISDSATASANGSIVTVTTTNSLSAGDSVYLEGYNAVFGVLSATSSSFTFSSGPIAIVAGDVVVHQVMGGATYTYDANGSQTSAATGGVTTGYLWDLGGRMIGIDANNDGDAADSGDTEYAYDSAGVRISEVQHDTTDSATVFVNDDANPTGYSKTLELKRGTSVANATLDTTYVLGLQVEGQHDSAGAVWFVRDGHGSNRVLADDLGLMIEKYDYSAFGDAVGFNPAEARTTVLYGGDGVYDSASHWTYHLARWRDGFRFVSADDPRYGQADDPASLHKYLYASGNPLAGRDPSGHMDLIDVASSGTMASVLLYSGMIGGYVNTTMSNPDNAFYFSAGFYASTTDTLAGLARVSGFFEGAWAGLLTFADNYTFHEFDFLHNARTSAWSHLGMSSTEKTTNIIAWIGVAALHLASILDAIGADVHLINCFVAGTPVLLGDGQTTEAIDDIHVGQRVATDGGMANSADGKTAATDPSATEVDPATWRLARIESDDWEVQTLVPLGWIQAHAVARGSLLQMSEVVDLAEMGVPDDLIGTVESISACPAIEGGYGRVVLTTVSHLNSFVYDLMLGDSQGNTDNLGVTGYHRLYTEDRGWVVASELYVGETVRTARGDVRVTGLLRESGVYRVYNMTVEADHDYYVGDLTALVHNTCTPAELKRMEWLENEIRETEVKINNILKGNRKRGDGPYITTGSEQYIIELAEELAKLQAKL